MTAEPTKPVAPVTKTRMISSPRLRRVATYGRKSSSLEPIVGLSSKLAEISFELLAIAAANFKLDVRHVRRSGFRIFVVFRENGVVSWRRIQRFQQVQSAP